MTKENLVSMSDQPVRSRKGREASPRLESLPNATVMQKEPALVARGDGQRNRDDVTKVETLI